MVAWRSRLRIKRPVAGAGGTHDPPTPPGIAVTANRTQSLGTYNFRMGVSPLQSPWGRNTYAETARAKWQAVSEISFQHVLSANFGSGRNITSAPGVYDFTDSDILIPRMETYGQEPGVTLGLCPTRLKRDTADTNSDPIRTTTAYNDFAATCAAVANRYPQVTYYQVWNEMKGFFGGFHIDGGSAVGNRWNYEDFTTLYNKVYTAVKAIRSGAQMGGPYTPMRHSIGTQSNPTVESPLANRSWGTMDQRVLTATKYWLQNKSGAQFINMDYTPFTDSDGVTPSNVFQAIRDYYEDIKTWFRSLSAVTYPGASTLPLVWSELYTGPIRDSIWGSGSQTPETTNQQNERRMMGMLQIIRLMKAKFWGAWWWQSQGGVDLGNIGIWMNTDATYQAAAFPIYAPLVDFRTHFGTGADIILYEASSEDDMLEVIASDNHVMVLNLENTAKDISINGGSTHTIGAWGCVTYAE